MPTPSSKMEVFGDLYTVNGDQPYHNPQTAFPCIETRNTTYRLLRSFQLFMLILPVSQNPMLCSGPNTPLKVPLPTGKSAPSSNSWYPELTRLSIPNGISISLAVFAQLVAEYRYILQRAATFPRIITFSEWGSRPASNIWFLGPIRTVARSAHLYLNSETFSKFRNEI